MPRTMKAALRNRCQSWPRRCPRTIATTYPNVRARARAAPKGSKTQDVSAVAAVSGGNTPRIMAHVPVRAPEAMMRAGIGPTLLRGRDGDLTQFLDKRG